MSYGRAYTVHLQNENVLFLSSWMGLRLLNNQFSLITQSAHLCKIKAQFENIIASKCRAKFRLYSTMWYTKLHR